MRSFTLCPAGATSDEEPALELVKRGFTDNEPIRGTRSVREAERQALDKTVMSVQSKRLVDPENECELVQFLNNRCQCGTTRQSGIRLSGSTLHFLVIFFI